MQRPSTKSGKRNKKQRNLTKGTISCTSAGRLLSYLLHTEQSGIIRFAGIRRKMNVIVSGGNLLEIQSNYIREDTLGRHLVGENIITLQESQASLKKARESQLPQGQALVGMHLITQNDLLEHVTKHKTKKFLKLFSGAWDGSDYEFFPQQVAVRKSLMEPVPIAKVLKVGILKIAKLDTLYKTFDNRNLFNHPILLAPDFNHMVALLELKPKTADRARWLAGKSLQEARNLDQANFERILRLVFLMIIGQGARFDSQSKETISIIETPSKKPAETKPEKQLQDTVSPKDRSKVEQALSDAKNFFEDNDYRIAKTFLDRAYKIDPKHPEVLAMLAWADYQLKGKNDPEVASDCVEMGKKAVRIDPECEAAHLYLGKIYKHQNQKDLAAPHFIRANQINPDNEEIQREVRLINMQKRKQSQYTYLD